MVAACDLDKKHLQQAVDTINSNTATRTARRYHDYHEMLARDDIDAVMIAIPDHWHAIVATEAAARKKDIYGEKPLARTIAEQQAIVKAVQKNNIIWQTGSWQRSLPPFHKAAEIVRNGLIGNVTHVEVGLPGAPSRLSRHRSGAGAAGSHAARQDQIPCADSSRHQAWDLSVTQPPPDLDYDTWIGPSKMEPYIECACLSELALELQHRRRPASGLDRPPRRHRALGLGFDLTGPSEVQGFGEFPAGQCRVEHGSKYTVECTYRKEVTGYLNDVSVTIAGGHPAISMGTKWIGTDGWVWVDRSGFDASNPEWVKMEFPARSAAQDSALRFAEHRRNFLDSVKSRKPTITPVEVAHHSTIPGHLGLISMLVGRKLHWDVKEEKILNDPEATALMTREYRAPYKLG